MGKRLRKFFALIMVSVCTVGFALPACAQASLDDILKRVEALEKENSSLKAEVMALKERPAAPAQVAAAPAAAATGNFLSTKLPMELYGFIKVDGVYSDSEASAASATNSSTSAYNAPYNALGGRHQGDFNMSGQSTRLGINFKPVDLDNGGKVSGKFEMDFSAAQTASYNPRLRLAYVQADYDKWGVTAGQAWDFFAPVNSNLLNDANVWRAGNVGFRHPQVYLTNKWGEMLGGKLNTKLGIIDTDDQYQENSRIPVFGASVGYDTKIAGMASSFNVGGIWGQSSTELMGTLEGGKTNDIYGVVASSTVKMTDWLAFKAKGFTGAKLEDFMSNNGVGLAVSNRKGLRVMGGFAELCYNPIKKVETNFGLGIDSLVSANSSTGLGSTAIWDTNKTYYTNVKYSLSKDLLLGLEYQRFDTKWIGGAESSDNRVQSSLILKF
jgi:hypothetical protein